MIKVRFSCEAITDVLFTTNNPCICSDGLAEPLPIVDVTFDDGTKIITFLFDDGHPEITDMALSYENPFYEMRNHISKYEKKIVKDDK